VGRSDRSLGGTQVRRRLLTVHVLRRAWSEGADDG
jgi:hypothetical protein